MTHSPIKLNPTKRIALIGILAALAIVGRLAMTALPNVQPLTSIVVATTFIVGLSFSIPLTLVALTASSVMQSGIGVYLIIQCLGYLLCLIAIGLLKPWLTRPKMLIWRIVAIAAVAFVYGFIANALSYIIYGSFDGSGFLTYAAASLSFDGAHALGNIIMYPFIEVILVKLFQKISD